MQSLTTGTADHLKPDQYIMSRTICKIATAIASTPARADLTPYQLTWHERCPRTMRHSDRPATVRRAEESPSNNLLVLCPSAACFARRQPRPRVISAGNRPPPWLSNKMSPAAESRSADAQARLYGHRTKIASAAVLTPALRSAAARGCMVHGHQLGAQRMTSECVVFARRRWGQPLSSSWGSRAKSVVPSAPRS